MQKLVNIYPIKPILNVNPPIRTRVLQITIDTDMIRKCLISGAIVEEILNGGKTKTLTLSNYDKDNDTKVEEYTPAVEESKVEETVKTVEAPKVEESVKPQQQFKKFNKYNNRRNVETPKVEEPKVEEKLTVEEPKVEETSKTEDAVEAPKVEESVKPEETIEKE